METKSHRAQWMVDGSYGVMTHYLLSPGGETPEARTAELNRIIDGFDLDYFMKQFEESGADWLIFTIGQNTGYYNSSNCVLDRFLPGHTPKRDLILEIAQRVKKLNKRFICYSPAEVRLHKPDILNAFGWDPDDQTHFLKRYLLFIRAYSEKFGLSCDGWWFDGCYESIHHGKWNWQDWCDAIRAGNPNSIVAFNDGAFCLALVKPITPLEDYHPGEVHLLHDGKIVLGYPPSWEFKYAENGRLIFDEKVSKLYMPDSRFIDGVQWHALAPIDSTFNPSVPATACHYSDEELLKFILGCKAVGGAVTLNVPINVNNGHISEETAAQLKRIGKAIRNHK
jgi:hypothetical protein